MRSHLGGLEHVCVDQVPDVYSIRIAGHLGPTGLCGVLAEIEALGLELVELRRLDPRRIQGA